MSLYGELFDQNCEMNYTSYIVPFVLAFEMKTGYIPVYIDRDNLPENRRNIWGS
jgi:hypothetical protein